MTKPHRKAAHIAASTSRMQNFDKLLANRAVHARSNFCHTVMKVRKMLIVGS